MKFLVNREELLGWITAINRSFVFMGKLHEIYRCVKLNISEKGLVIEVADNVNQLKVDCLSIEWKSDVDIVDLFVDKELLQRILSSTGKKNVKFEVYDSYFNIITETKYKLFKVDGSSYPEIEFPDQGFNKLDDIGFLNVVDKMIPFVAKDLIRPELAGVSIGDSVYISTDAICGVIHKRVEDSLESATIYPYVILLLSSIKELKDLEILLNDSSVYFRGQNFQYSCQLPETEFPFESMNEVLSLLSDTTKISVLSTQFFEAFDRVSLMALDKFNQLHISLNKVDDKFELGLECISYANKSQSKEVLAVDVVGELNAIDLFIDVGAMQSCKKLFGGDEGKLILLVKSGQHPLFVRQEGSKYLFFSRCMNKMSGN